MASSAAVGRRRLGGEAVVDGQHAETSVAARARQRRVVGVEVADHPAATVEEDEQAATRVAGDVQARAELPVRPADGELGHTL